MRKAKAILSRTLTCLGTAMLLVALAACTESQILADEDGKGFCPAKCINGCPSRPVGQCSQQTSGCDNASGGSSCDDCYCDLNSAQSACECFKNTTGQGGGG
jgi:hypothetical protein